MGHIDPTKEIFAQFKANDRPGPIHMLNLVRLRAQAAYPDGRKASGAEAYAAYGRESGPVFERLGGKNNKQKQNKQTQNQKTPPGGGGGFAADQARGAAGRQD